MAIKYRQFASQNIEVSVLLIENKDVKCGRFYEVDLEKIWKIFHNLGKTPN